MLSNLFKNNYKSCLFCVKYFNLKYRCTWLSNEIITIKVNLNLIKSIKIIVTFLMTCNSFETDAQVAVVSARIVCQLGILLQWICSKQFYTGFIKSFVDFSKNVCKMMQNIQLKIFVNKLCVLHQAKQRKIKMLWHFPISIIINKEVISDTHFQILKGYSVLMELGLLWCIMWKYVLKYVCTKKNLILLLSCYFLE